MDRKSNRMDQGNDTHTSKSMDQPTSSYLWQLNCSPQWRTSATALFDYISAGRSTHRAWHHWRPNLSGGCCICLEQSAGVSTGIAVSASFSQQTEDRAFCPVVQLLWLRASHCTDYHVTSLLFLRVTCPCSLRTYATLKFIRSSSSPSSSRGKQSFQWMQQ